MKPLSFVLAILAPGLLAGALAGCSASQQHGSVSQSPGGPMRGPGASAGGSGAAGSTHFGYGCSPLGAGMTADQVAMCELNRRITSARTPQERQAMLDQYLPGMSPEARARRLQMMQERCR
jgi:hypothetical protein